jgi:hypothetical protein
MSTLFAVVVGFLAVIGLLSLLSGLAVWVLSHDIDEPDVSLGEQLRGAGYRDEP